MKIKTIKGGTTMILPDGFFVIHQPKQRIPGVFDLHKRGRFKTRPFVTRNWDYRVIASTDLVIRLQYAHVIEKKNIDPETRIPYNFLVRESLIDLDENLEPDTKILSKHIPDKTIRKTITAAHAEWRNAYVPMTDGARTDRQDLEKKIRASITESREVRSRQMADKNRDWVMAALPRLIQNFTYGVYIHVREELNAHYRQLGGESDENQLFRKISLFFRVYENNGDNLLQKPDNSLWENEDEIWECWAGFAGSETEAKRVWRTMEAVFRPLAQKYAA
jgi:hypothetical protein